MNYLITGATGLLGNNVLRLLLKEENSVTVTVRAGGDPRPMDGLNVEKVEIDLATDAANGGSQFRSALEGIDMVIHCAGLIQLGWSRLEDSMAVHRDAANSIAEACRLHKVRMIHVSSVDALAASVDGTPVNEDQVDPPKVETSYVRSKRAGDVAIWEQIAKGLDGTIVHPGLMFGPWDWKPSSGEMMLAIARQFIPFAPNGGVSVCDVRDVSAGMVSLTENWRSGESYILAGINTTYLELWHDIAKLLNRKPPLAKLPGWLGVVVGGVSDFTSRFTKAESQSNSGAIKSGSILNWYDSSKAERDLGYKIGPIDVALKDLYDWFLAYDYLKSKR